MHQNAFGGRGPLGPAGGAYSAPPVPLAGLKGEGRREWRGKGKGKGEGKGRGRNEERGGPPMSDVR